MWRFENGKEPNVICCLLKFIFLEPGDDLTGKHALVSDHTQPSGNETETVGPEHKEDPVRLTSGAKPASHFPLKQQVLIVLGRTRCCESVF